MIVSKIKIRNKLYINLHAEQSVTGTFEDISLLDNDLRTGIFCKVLTKSTMQRIVKYFENDELNFDYLVIDFHGIQDLQKHNEALFFRLLDALAEKTIVLQNITQSVLNRLSLSSLLKNEKPFHSLIAIKNKSQVNEKKFSINESNEVFEKEFESKLKKYSSNHKNKFHYSSSIYLPRFINIKKFIENDKSFFLYTLYRLAIKMSIGNDNRTWQIKENDKDVVLFCQNLNSSIIASILSNFLLLDITILDHIGPINKLYYGFEDKIQKDKNYIIVSDVVCLGTEVRIAKNLIEFSGGNYLGNVSIVRVNTVLDKHRFNDIEAVYEISKDKNPINYKILTAFDIK